MHKVAHVLLRTGVIFLVCAHAFSQQGTAQRKQEMLIPVVVTDSSGASASGLQADDFLIRVGSEQIHPQKVEYVRPWLLPPTKSGRERMPIFLIVDKVVPAAPDMRRSVVRPALRFLAHSVEDDQPVTLLEIDAEGLKLVHSFDTPAPVLAAALQLLDQKTRLLGGHFKSTAAAGIPDTLKQKVGDELSSLEQFAASTMPHVAFRPFVDAYPVRMEALRKFGDLCRKTPGRKAAFWITGPEDASFYSPTDGMLKNREYEGAMQALNEGQVSIFPVTMFPNGIYTLNLAFDESNFTIGEYGVWLFDFVRRVATSTGGSVLFLGSHISSTIRPTVSHFSSYYLLSYFPSAAQKETGWTKLEVTTQRPGVRVRSRDGFFAMP